MVEDALLQEIKDKVRVTWDHEDERLRGMGAAAQRRLNELCNMEHDYTFDDTPKTLMLERVFYQYNNILYEFETNYSEELGGLIIRSALRKKGRKKSSRKKGDKNVRS